MNPMKLQDKSLKTAALLLSCLLGIWTAQAGIVQNTIDPFEQLVFIDCDSDGIPEDVIELSGGLHTVITQTLNKGGGSTFTAHFQPVNVSAVGLITGDTYRAVGLTRSSDIIRGDNEEFTFVNNFYMIGQKAGIKYLVHETFHVTIIDGELVVVQAHANVRCL